MSADISDAFKIQYESEYAHALQNLGGRLRDTVWVRNSVQGNQVRFPVLAASDVTKNRARHSLLTGQDDRHSNVTATLNNYESFDFIDSLDEFKTDADYRGGYTQSNIMALNSQLDKVVLDAVNSSHTSEGSAATITEARIAGMREIAGENNWAANEEWYWVVTPAVFSEVLQINEVVSSDYSQGGVFEDGGKSRQIKAMGFTFIESPELNSSDYWTSATSHNTYVYSNKMVGLGVGRDITPKVNYSVPHNSTILLAEMSAGAVTIQTAGVYEVEVNGL